MQEVQRWRLATRAQPSSVENTAGSSENTAGSSVSRRLETYERYAKSKVGILLDQWYDDRNPAQVRVVSPSSIGEIDDKHCRRLPISPAYVRRNVLPGQFLIDF